MFKPNGTSFSHNWSSDVDSRIAAQVNGNITAQVSGMVKLICEQNYDTVTGKWGMSNSDYLVGKVNRIPGGAKATAIDQLESSPAREAFYPEVLFKSPAQVRAHCSKGIFTGRGQPPPIVTNVPELKGPPSQNLSAIAYIDEAQFDLSVRFLRTP